MAIKSLFKHHLHLDSGALASGAQMFFYVPGTATPKDTYTTAAGTVANANPVILNTRGEAEIWLDGLYDVNAKTSVATGSAQITGYPVSSVGAGSSNNDANLRWGGTSTGSANAQAISPDPSITSYTIGQSFVFKAGFTNTGATTIAISGLTGIAIQNGGVALVGGEIVAGKLYEVVLDTLTTCQLPNAVTATTATNTGGKTTIASAATPDIFATSVGTIVDYTGTATCTGFVAAPQAGATKRLICAGACLFTAGANLLIEGIPSGTTITLAANAIVDVTAITTTLFKMTYSVSGTTSSTFTFNNSGGTTGTVTMSWSVVNGLLNLLIPAFSATSGAASNAITNNTALPACARPIVQGTASCNSILQASAGIASAAPVLMQTSGIIQITKDNAASAFSATSVCGISQNINISFKIA